MNILVKNIITFILLTISYFCDIVITDQNGFATTVLLFIIPALQESVDEIVEAKNNHQSLATLPNVVNLIVIAVSIVMIIVAAVVIIKGFTLAQPVFIILKIIACVYPGKILINIIKEIF